MKKDKELERLEAENRELKKLNRQLLKKLKQVNKGYRKVRDSDVDETDEPEEKEDPKMEVCPKCFERKLKEVKFTILGKKEKIITICDSCGHRVV